MAFEQPVQHGFVPVPGARIYYEVAGTGSPVVLQHGGFLDRRVWDNHFQFLARQHQVIRYDMRGSGLTEVEPTTSPFIPHQDLPGAVGEYSLP
ncbi:alpha/beta fold hydrolase [Dictyobacter arantiisoli]|uniref:AB hydrolase-1 domain-containing protein n=1 Tax=Dictyobacter arantiisoli TaxID=2014874 RepID=A0A5A5TJG7_9CHLR|nr:alpha/beta hydrolase [Dictyobacter arantiisoli]GCF11378.1 hypothetical protein KDI_49420 [Dictyobacter arantiisoli]